MRIAIAGAAGKMGRTLTRIASETPGIEIAGGLEAANSPHLGADMGELAGIGTIGKQVGSDSAALFAAADGVLDFTLARATTAMCEASAKAGIVHVIGTTGLSESDEAAISKAAQRARIVKSGNMSLAI
jgi:4-hydroxy-tetrahydrodipicolinate reductase